jgi:hypothetical protein
MRMAVWWVEWRLVGTRLRPFGVGTLAPLAIVVPMATGAVSTQLAAAMYTVVFTAFVVLGSAVPLRWEGERGMVARIEQGGVAPWSYLFQRTSVGAVVGLVQLTPALLVVAGAVGASAADAAVAFGALALSAWVGGLLGVLVAGASRAVGEAGLLGGLLTFLLTHMSGVFRTPAESSTGALLERVSPFRALHESLLEMTTGAPWAGGTALILWAAVLPAAVAALAPPLVVALQRRAAGAFEGI